MKEPSQPSRGSGVPATVLACGGTGGHLMPALAIAAELRDRGCRVLLLASRKTVDRTVARTYQQWAWRFLPGTGFSARNPAGFSWGVLASIWLCQRWFSDWRPHIVLGMGGFSSVAPVLVGRLLKARVCLHEGNAVMGRANRFLQRFADRVFLGFNPTKGVRWEKKICHAGTPVRLRFRQLDRAACRRKMELEPDRPVLLVMGGSQGADGLNRRVKKAIPLFAARFPDLQYLHLAGFRERADLERVYRKAGRRFKVVGFLDRMEVALGAADAAVSRSGASTLAELAAVGLPALLLPFPDAADGHQEENARRMEEASAACWLRQADAVPGTLVSELSGLLFDRRRRDTLKAGLRKMDIVHAAARVADGLFDLMRCRPPNESPEARAVPRGEGPSPRKNSNKAAEIAGWGSPLVTSGCARRRPS